MTPIIRVRTQADLDEAIRLATEVLEAGGVVLYPTDTTYALAVNALNAGAVDRVFRLKGRDYTKPIHVIVKDLDQAERYVTINGVAQEIAAQFLPGALTLVLPLKTNAGVPSLLVAGASTLGIRIPNHPVCEALSQALDFPVTTTSANRSGQPNTYLVESVEQQLAMDFDKIDLAIDVGALPGGGVSTVIGIEGESIKLIREGTIPFATISQLIDHTRRKV